jgi:D-glycero-alpha-D-manno-heptose-7-phosphate kinase
MPQSLTRFLSKQPVTASAPCRVDSGGTWDIKAMALPLEGMEPTTINIALTLRTSVSLFPYDEGMVKISSEGFGRSEVFSKDLLPFNGPFGLFFSAVSRFGFHGLEVRINSSSPVKSGLGGSSTALVALIKALSRTSEKLGGERLAPREILHVGYHLEDGISGGNCGPQDQGAAVYGGVNQWKWHYGNRNTPFERTSLLDRKGQRALSSRLLVAYCGKAHVSKRTNRSWIRGFLEGETRSGWVRANEIVKQLASTIKEQDWKLAAGLLREEMAVRKGITPEALIPITSKLVEQAERVDCGARFAGAGAGGSLWALGEIKNIERLRKIWKGTLAPIRGAGVLDCEVDPYGVK